MKNKINFQKVKEFKEYVSIEHEKSSRNQASNSIPKSLNTIKINCALKSKKATQHCHLRKPFIGLWYWSHIGI